jgi:hypothetical protein
MYQLHLHEGTNHNDEERLSSMRGRFIPPPSCLTETFEKSLLELAVDKLNKTKDAKRNDVAVILLQPNPTSYPILGERKSCLNSMHINTGCT